MKKRIFGWLWIFIEVLVVIYVILVTSYILFINKYGFTQFGNYTMTSIDEVNVNYLNEGKDGNLLVIKNSNDIKKGDLIYYYAGIEEEYVIKNGVVEEVVKIDNSGFYTLSDDSSTSISSERIIGVDAKQYKLLGSIMDVLESNVGFLLLVLLPILFIFIYQVYKLIMVIKDDDIDDYNVKDCLDEKKDNVNATNQGNILKNEEISLENNNFEDVVVEVSEIKDEYDEDEEIEII